MVGLFPNLHTETRYGQVPNWVPLTLLRSSETPTHLLTTSVKCGRVTTITMFTLLVSSFNKALVAHHSYQRHVERSLMDLQASQHIPLWVSIHHKEQSLLIRQLTYPRLQQFFPPSLIHSPAPLSTHLPVCLFDALLLSWSLTPPCHNLSASNRPLHSNRAAFIFQHPKPLHLLPRIPHTITLTKYFHVLVVTTTTHITHHPTGHIGCGSIRSSVVSWRSTSSKSLSMSPHWTLRHGARVASVAHESLLNSAFLWQLGVILVNVSINSFTRAAEKGEPSHGRGCMWHKPIEDLFQLKP